jgi:hypothetical protein
MFETSSHRSILAWTNGRLPERLALGAVNPMPTYLLRMGKTPATKIHVISGMVYGIELGLPH